jgi:hypothetical protein
MKLGARSRGRVVRSRGTDHPIQYHKNILQQTSLEMEYKINLKVPKCGIVFVNFEDICHFVFFTQHALKSRDVLRK